MTHIHLTLICLPILIGWILDRLAGDPQGIPHPIVGFGKIISFGEKRLNQGHNRKAKGAFWSIFCILSAFAITLLILNLSALNTSLYLIVSGTVIFFCLAGKTLRNEVKMTFEAVDRSTEEGRKQVSRIVGRDTSNLSPQEIRTAALETLAENLSDGVIAPLFWLFVLGIPGMAAYKMINTLDSMIGYRNERYKDFGCWAARIDDFANYIPARITAILIIISAKALELWKNKLTRSSKPLFLKKFKSLILFTAFFGPKHSSPNSGWPEAALASILDCRFGGPHNYFGEEFYKPYIGTNPRMLNTEDMELSITIASIAEIIMIVLIILSLAGGYLLS